MLRRVFNWIFGKKRGHQFGAWLQEETCPIAHAFDDGGEFFWPIVPEAKDALDQIKKQMDEQVPGSYEEAAFDGIYIPNRAIGHYVYEVLMKQGGFPISNYTYLGRLIDTQ